MEGEKLYQWFSEHGPQTSSICFTWKLVRDTKAKATPPHTGSTESETLGMGGSSNQF